MAVYVDSSLLLSLLLGDAHGKAALALWRRNDERVSSLLLELECTIGLRRAMVGKPARAAAELSLRLQSALEEVTLKPLDQDVIAVIHETPELVQCRSLDAAHLATALFFRSAAGDDLPICTFDKRMSETASKLGFSVLRT